ncbi:nestin [Dugong dugon]
MEGCLGEESFQMWELNRRLEIYLSRVKALEEQNELLSAELGGLRAQSADASWRARADDELAALRALVDQRWREKHAAEVARDNLAEELEGVAGRCQQQRLAREQAAEEAARSRRAVEAEKCAQTWLSNQAADLERELEALRAEHEEERACLNAQAARAPRCPAPPRGPPAPAPEVEELAQRLGEAWRGAVRGYQERVAHMETSLGQARERLGHAVQGAREGRLELQQLQAERGGLQERRAALEQRLEGRWQERLRATEKFQLAVEALEQEKQGLQNQIAQVLEGRQQLAHLKMSLSLEVATYRTLLEAENTRLQTPGSGSKASLGFQVRGGLDPKPELHFLGTPEGRRLAPLLPVLSTTSLTSPLPDTIRTPMPTFPKRQEFLQACTPTLASTPISPTPQTPYPATDTEIRAQEAPLSLLQSQGGKQEAPEPLWAEAKVAIPASNLPGPEEPGGKQQEASPGQSPEDHVSLAPPPNPDHPSLEAKDGEPSGSGMSSISREEGEGQIWGLKDEEATIEVKVGSTLQQETWQEEGDVDREEIQEPQSLLEKETPKALEEEIQEPLMSLEKQSHETQRSLEKENQDSLRSLEEENLETPKTLEKENQELLKSLEEKGLEIVSSVEKETLELLTPIEKEDSQTLQSLEKENQEFLRSVNENLETFLFPGKENQELVRSLEEENLESLRALEKESQEPLRSQEVEDQEALGPLAKENQEPLRSQEVEDQEALGPLAKENQEPLKSREVEDQETLRPLEKENEEPLKSLKIENQETLRTLEKENQESLKSLEDETQEILENVDQEPLKSLKIENQETLRTLEKENQESLKSLEDETQEILENVDQEPLKSLKIENQETLRTLEKENQESLKSLEDETQEILENVDQEPLKSLKIENQETLKTLKKETQESLKSLEDENQETLENVDQEPLESQEKENQETLRTLEKETQESLKSLEDENQEILENTDQEPLKSLKIENKETLRTLEKETQESLKSLEDENQETLENVDQEPLESQEEENQKTLRSLEKETQEPLGSSGEEDQKTLKPLEKENQELLRSLKEDSVEAVKSLEIKNLESLKSAETEALRILKPPETEEPLWSLEEENQETMKALEKEIQEPLVSVEETQETSKPLEKENQEPLRSLGEWDLENLKSSEEVDKESPKYLEEEENLEKGENTDLLRSLEDEGQELPLSANQKRWEDVVGVDQELSHNPPPGRDEVENKDEAELGPKEQDDLDGKEEVVEQVELLLNATGEAGNTGEGYPGSPEPEQQRVPVDGAKGEGGAEGHQDPEGQPDQVGAPGLGAPQGMPEMVEPMLKDEDVAPGSDPASLQVALASETAMGESAVGAEEGLEQEAVALEDPGHLAREEVMEPPLGEEGLEAKKVQGLGEPRKGLKEADALESELSQLPGESRDPRKPEESESWEETESEAAWGAEEGLPAGTLCLDGIDAPQPRPEEDAKPAPGPPSPRPPEPWVPTSLPEDAPGPQPQTEGKQEASWGLEGRAEAPEKLEGEQELGSGGIPEGLQEEGEESGEESEADELGETLPDSTPLVLFPGSAAFSEWGPAGEERPSPQGEARQEGWDPTILASEGLGTHPSEEEGRDEEEGHSRDSDLSEEFEDLGTEASLLPGVPREVAEPLRQVPQLLLEPAVWDRDEESDGFADEEESGEEGEENEEGRGPGSSVGGLQSPCGPQRGDPVESETVGVSAPMTALETESQDSAEPSSSEEESDLVPLDREDKVSGPLETPSGVEDMGHQGAGETLGVNGQGPSWEESQHLNGGLVTRLEQSEGGGQGKPEAPEGERGSPLEVEEGGSLKAPWAGVPLCLGQGQYLKFTQREGEGDSWSSGED